VIRRADLVSPNDLSSTVDAPGNRAAGGQGVVEGGEDAATKEEAVGGAIVVIPDDLACAVDALCNRGAARGKRIIEADVAAPDVEETVSPAKVTEASDNLARVVDVLR